jgi:aerobic-type carbon monoxide dehydrogenase small subunit (CoxS/CutS family)
MKCEFINEKCFQNGYCAFGFPICNVAQVCSEKAEICKRRKLKLQGKTDAEIDEMWKVPEKYRVK